jgi:hypothetical protein
MQNFDFNFTVQDDIDLEMETGGNVGGVANYNLLDNKPQINGVELLGNKTASELGLDDYSDLDNKPQINGVTLSGNKNSETLKIPGKIVAGQTYTVDGTTRTAYDGAEVFNHTEANVAVGAYSRATGLATKAIGNFSSANGYQTTARGNYSHTFGQLSEASGDHSSAEGWSCTASGIRSHAGGYQSTASGGHSFAYGQNATASGSASCAIGAVVTASGDFSHASGAYTTASGDSSFASGYECQAKKAHTVAIGDNVVADSINQVVLGSYNVLDSNNKFAFILGNGYYDNANERIVRSNLLAVDFAGKLYLNNSAVGIDLAEIGELADSGAKNLLNPAAAVGYVGQSGYPISKSGITYTLDANSETITLSDTATSVSTLRIPITLSPGTYHVSGIPSGGSDSSYRADLREAGGNVFITNDFDYGSGFSFTLSATTSLDYCIRVANGYNPSSVVVSPMICTEAAWSVSQQFVKYRPSYDELITRIEALEQANGISTNAVSQSRGIKTIEDI